MLSPTQAIKNALGTSRNPVGMCDHQVGVYYGYSSSGYATAIAHWNAISGADKHPGDLNPPAGALVFWSGGSSGAGHVALSLGGGKIVSTDYPRAGITSTTTIDAISNGWGEHYMGWSKPVFQGQVNQASFPSNPASSGNMVGGVLGGSSVLDFLTGGFGTDVKDLAERAGIILFGGILILVGLITMNKKKVKALIKEEKGKRNAVDKEGAETQEETGS